MLRSFVLTVFLSFCVVNGDHVDIYYTDKDVFHVSPNATTSDVPLGALECLVMDSFGHPDACPDVSLPFTADSSEPVHAYLLVLVESSLPEDAKLVKDVVGVYALSNTSAKETLLNSLFVTFPNAVHAEKTYEANESDESNESNEPTKGKEELDAMVQQIADSDVSKEEEPVFLFSLTVQSKAEEAERIMKEDIAKVMDALEAKYKQIGVQVISLSFIEAETKAETTAQRRLEEEPTTETNVTDVTTEKNSTTDENANVTATVSNSTNHTVRAIKSGGAPNGYSPESVITMEDIESYQLVLWTSFFLVLITLYAIFAVINMDAKKDSLLYSGFLTESARRKMD